MISPAVFDHNIVGSDDKTLAELNANRTSTMCVFSDGTSFEDGVRAAAVAVGYSSRPVRRLHLNPINRHTVCGYANDTTSRSV